MKNFFKRVGAFFKKELKTIILSVICAIVIWFAVSIQAFPNVYDHIDGVTVSAEPTAFMQKENLMITDYDKEVTVQLHGKRYVIGTLEAKDFVASLDLSGITSPGEHTVNVGLSKVQPSDDYDIVSEGLTAKVTVERIISKDIALEVNTDNLKIAEDLQIQTDGITLSSSMVTVSGEQTLVDSVARAVIEPLYSDTLTETTRISGTVSLYDANGTKIDDPKLEYIANNYSVTVPLYRVKTLPLNVSIIYPPNFDSSSLKYTIYPKEITIAAPANDLSINNLEQIDVDEINLTEITARDLQVGLKFTISLSEGYKNLSNVAVAQINFQDVDSYTRRDITVSVSNENFTFLNGDPSYDYSFVTSQLTITAIGPSNLLYNLTPDDISGTVNLLGTNSEEGVKNVTVSLRIAGQRIKAWINGDYKVDVRITQKQIEE
ncbi:MAG TPA: hypothetical protein DDX91_09695 [Ruminococcaceae bacterium]|nr:hypothetical protein [Oscillospiraceae bacterium]